MNYLEALDRLHDQSKYSITITRDQLLRACGNAGIPHTTAMRIMAYLPPMPAQAAAEHVHSVDCFVEGTQVCGMDWRRTAPATPLINDDMRGVTIAPDGSYCVALHSDGTMTDLNAVPAAGIDAHRYRKRPVVIEAFQFQRRNNGPVGQLDWFHDAVTRNDVILRNTGKFNDPTQPASCEIKTLEGVMRADEGDWIIRGVKGELYPCKPDIFAATYEPAATGAQPHTNNKED